MTEKQQEKRIKILQAVENLARNKRFHEVTLDDVAQEAQVGKGTIYRFFKDKDDLFFQLATHGHDELCDRISEFASTLEDISFEDRLTQMCTQISDFFLGRHALLRVIGDHESRMHALHMKHRENFEKHRTRLLSAIAKVLAVGIPGGEIRTGLPLETQATFLLGLMRSRDHAFGPDPSQRPPISMVVDIFLNGVRDRASSEN